MSKPGKLPFTLAAALLVLGGGYLAQVWWADRIARQCVHEEVESGRDAAGALDCSQVCERALAKWRTVPWYGIRDKQFVWVPRRAYWELFRAMTGKDLADEPDSWAEWLRAHPALVWDERSRRMVDP